MPQTWNTILAMAAVLLPLASSTGTASLQIQDATQNVETVFLGWDNVILVNDAISQMVRDAVCNDAVYPACDQSSLNDPYIVAQAFSSYIGAAIISVDMLLNAFGGEERYYQMTDTVEELRAVGRVYLVSTSVYPFTAEQWFEFLKSFTNMLQFGFADDEIITVADPGDGTTADTGIEIQKVMDNIGVQFDGAIFVDSSEIIDAATEVCNTLSLEAGGLTKIDRLYLDMLTLYPLPLGEISTCPPETTCPETTCPPEVETTEAPTGIVYADKACGSRTYIGKAHDPVLCSEMVMDDARCTNKDYFMYRAANAACNCVGAADDCYSDLHTVAGVHIYTMSFFGQA